MSDDLAARRESDERHLAAALHWLRLRLARHTAVHHPPSEEPPAAASEPRRCRRRTRAADDARRQSPHAGPAITDEQVDAAAAEVTAAAAADPPPALVRLGQKLRLTPFEQSVLMLCAAPEFDPSFGARCAAAQGDTRHAFPTFALALAALPDPQWDALSPQGGLRRWRLVEIAQPAGQALVTSALRVDERIMNALKGLDHPDDRLEAVLPPAPLPGAPLPPSQAAVAAEGARLARSGAPVVQLLGSYGTSAASVAAAVAAELRVPLHRLSAADLPSSAGELEQLARLWSRENVLLGAALYIDAHELDPADPAGVALGRFMAGCAGLVLLGTPEFWPGLAADAVAVEVARPTRAEQEAAWSAAIGADAGDTPAELAAQFDLDVATIRSIVTLRPAGGPPASERRPRPRGPLWDACLARTRPRLDALATRIRPVATWDDIVLPPAELDLLHRIAAQVAGRATVYDSWGFGERMTRGRGISVLFAGPSGAGKTTAAEVLANDLGLDLYRIDLAAVVSKYIGETEKNLRRVFDAADDGAALLLFDEADALFGKRSEVKDSHDRYANLGVADLLSRMEAYRGLAVLTTNMRGALDPAFLRRLRFVVNLPFPAPPQRRDIWQRVLPDDTPLADDVNLDLLADLPFTGATIHAVALNAAFAAAARAPERQVVRMADLLEAARTECRKLGLPVPDSRFVAPDPEVATCA